MHYRRLYEITLEPDVARSWEPSYQGGSFEDWMRRLWNGVFCQYGVRRRDLEGDVAVNASIDGLARCYGANLRHGTGRVAVFTSQRTHLAGLGMEAVALLIDFLFHAYPFRKLYAEALEYNYAKFADAAGTIFDIEAVLRGHEIHDGKAWDSYLLAVSREKWMETGARSVELARARGRRGEVRLRRHQRR
ncbi:MAG: GNAT family N-acetyltransferase [Myxococcales bacterium]|nr:GNAT family N-acetyltransferase [Myxococcales bacterium]